MNKGQSFRYKLADHFLAIGSAMLTGTTVGTGFASTWDIVILGFCLMIVFWSISYFLTHERPYKEKL